MRPENDDVGVRVFLAERAPRLLCHRAVGIESIVPFRIFALNRMMHQVAGDDRILSLRRNPHAVMAGGGSGGGSSPTSWVIRKFESIRSATPASTTGRTESSTGSRMSLPSKVEKKSHPVPPISKRASATRRPLSHF